MTLPLIYALNNTNSATRRKIINTVKNNNNNPEKVEEVIRFVKQSNGLQYAEKRMYEYQNEALTILNNFPESDYKKSLIALVRFTTERKY